MPKTELKRTKLGNTILSEIYPLMDVHRANPKANGGTYDLNNYSVLTPVAHMAEHGTLRFRDAKMEELKATIDDIEQVRKIYNKVNNQLLAYNRRTDHLNEQTKEWLRDEASKLQNELEHRQTSLAGLVKEIAKQDTADGKLAKTALAVKSVGPVTVAYCLVYIDLHKADHASSLWAYAGLDKPSHSRYTKNEAGGGNKTLRTKLYTLAESQVKGRGAYRTVYDNTKDRLAESEKMTQSRNTQGKLIECAWKDTMKSHRHGAALRAVMKHFLADYWFVGRTLHGLSTTPLYAEALLGKGHRTIMPAERGWDW
jgi:hypothetical protein